MRIPLKSTFTVNQAGFYSDDETSPVSDGTEVVVEIQNHGYQDNVLNTNKTTIRIGEQLFTLRTLNWVLEQANKYHKALVSTQQE